MCEHTQRGATDTPMTWPKKPAELRQWVSVMRSKRRQCHPPAEYHTLRGVQRALAPKSLVYDGYVEKNEIQLASHLIYPHTLSL